MPRIFISLALALALILGTLFIKHEANADSPRQATLIASEINTLNAPAIAQYAQELQSEAVNSSSTADTGENEPYPSANDASNTPAAPLNATQELSQNLFTQYISLKQSGVDVTSDGVAQQLASNLLSQPYVTGTSTVYAESNLYINAHPTKQDLVNYGNALGTILATPLATGAEQEVQIFETFAETNDASVLPGLSANISRYTGMQKKLLALYVPNIFVQDHVAIMNAISQIIHDISVVQASATDPVGAETALADYPNTVNGFGDALADEKTLFLQNNVSFSAHDAGYILTK